ncbi:MAG: radical SAM protein [Patescibacteria group bacterium]
MDRISFRLLELFFINNESSRAIQKKLRNEFGKFRSLKEILDFAKKVAKNLRSSLHHQRGRTDDDIWQEEWKGEYFSAPISNFWTFTNLCNLNCTHCAWDSSRPLSDELDTEACLRLIDQQYQIGVCELSFSGGEPLAKKKQLLQMGNYATKLGFHLGLATNATLVNDEVADELMGAGFSEVQVSVEGIEAHDSIRGRGVWDRTITGIRVLKHKRFDVTFAVTVNKTNFNELDSIFEMAIREGVKNVRFVRFVPIGRGKRNMSLFEFSVQDEVKLANILWQKRWELFPKITVTFNKHYVSIGATKSPQMGSIPESFGWNWDCPSGRSRICIMPQGKVAPCPLIGSLGLSGGDIREKSLKDIWEGSEFFQHIRSGKQRHNQSCAGCNFWSKCSGGCKASSYAHYGDLMAIDPLCFYEIGDLVQGGGHVT